MTTLKTYSSLLFFCAFAIGLFAQAAPNPRGGGPLQNPRPTNSNSEGGGDDYDYTGCDTSWPIMFDTYVYIDADYQAFEETHTLPSNMPDFHLAVYLNNDLSDPILVSPGFRSFLNSNYVCDSATPFDGYFYHHIQDYSIPDEILDIFSEECRGNEESTWLKLARFTLSYKLVTFESGILIDYPTSSYPEYFDCVGLEIFDRINVCAPCRIFGQFASEGFQLNGAGEVDGDVKDENDTKEDDIKDGEDKAGKRSIEDSNSSIYPNPFKDQITIEKDIIEIKIIDLKGAEVYSEQNPDRVVNTSSLQEGMYIIQYSDGNSWKATKMIKHN